MNQFATSAIAVGLFLLGAAFTVRIIYSDGSSSMVTYQRVAIVKTENDTTAGQPIMVRLAPGYVTELDRNQGDEIHPEATYVCAKISGVIERRNARATLAHLSACPLPVSTALPRSGRTLETKSSGKKTFRRIGGSARQSDTFPGTDILQPRCSVSSCASKP